MLGAGLNKKEKDEPKLVYTETKLADLCLCKSEIGSAVLLAAQDLVRPGIFAGCLINSGFFVASQLGELRP